MYNEDQLFKKRILELAQRSYLKHQYTFTNFLTPCEIDIFHQMSGELDFVSTSVYGGSPDNERQMIRFGSPETLGYEEEFPICIIKIEPSVLKFADSLTHRDFLGAIMNLGVERNVIGDILVKDKIGYLFCIKQMTEYLMENLTQIKHTTVKCSILAELPEIIISQPVPINLTVSSMRCDIIIAKLYNLSRSQSLTLFQEKKVFLNGRITENNSILLKDADVVTVRGFGKFISHESFRETKKGKQNIVVEKY